MAYRVTIKAGWWMAGLAAIAAGLWAIIGPGTTIEPIRGLTGTVADYRPTPLGCINEQISGQCDLKGATP